MSEQSDKLQSPEEMANFLAALQLACFDLHADTCAKLLQIEAHLRRSNPSAEVPIGKVVGHEDPGLALVQWKDDGLRPVGMPLYASPQSHVCDSAPVAWMRAAYRGRGVSTDRKYEDDVPLYASPTVSATRGTKFNAEKFYTEFRTGLYGAGWTDHDVATNHEHVESLEATVNAALNVFGGFLIVPSESRAHWKGK